jgi:hypothetical protein
MMETAAQGNTAIRPRLLAAATGTFVLLLAALAALSAGVAPALPLSAGVGVLGAAAFATAILAMGGRQVRARRFRAGAAAPEDADDRPSEEDRVHDHRERRFVALGVSEELAPVLAASRTVSAHDLARLIEKGCPVETAVRIVWPD